VAGRYAFIFPVAAVGMAAAVVGMVLLPAPQKGRAPAGRG